MVDAIKFAAYLLLVAIMMPLVWVSLMIVCSVANLAAGHRSRSETYLRDEEIILRETHG